MPDLSSLISQFIQQNGVSTALISAFAWFLIMRVWPWFTDQFWPAMVKRQDDRDKVTAAMHDTVLELRTLMQQLISSMEHQESVSKDLIVAISNNQQAILELLTPRTPPATSTATPHSVN